MHFRIQGLPAEISRLCLRLSDEALAQHGAVRRIADGPRPCRISLTDATPGDELILVNYEHHAVASPYRMRFAIFVRRGEETFDAVDMVPEQLRKRTLAVRAFDADAMMTGFDLADGRQLEAAIARPSPIRARPICISISPRPAATPPASSGRESAGSAPFASRQSPAAVRQSAGGAAHRARTLDPIQFN